MSLSVDRVKDRIAEQNVHIPVLRIMDEIAAPDPGADCGKSQGDATGTDFEPHCGAARSKFRVSVWATDRGGASNYEWDC